MTSKTRSALIFLFLTLFTSASLLIFFSYRQIETCCLLAPHPPAGGKAAAYLLPGASALILAVTTLAYLIIFCFLKNVAARQEKADQVAERLKLALKSGHFGIWDWDIVNDALVWDDRMLEMYGVSRDALCGVKTWVEGLHPEDRDRCRETLQAALKGEKPYDITFRVLHPDGSVRFIQADGTVIRDAAGKPLRMLGVNCDVTQQKTVLESVIRERNKAQLYLDIAGVLFAALDASGNITLINKRGCQILGHPEEALVGSNWFEICLPKSALATVKGVFAKQMAGEIESVEFFENPILTSRGEERIIAFHNTLLYNDAGEICGVLFSGEDITERKQLEEQLRHSQKLEAVGHLAGGIAHDFNNILTVIGGYGSLLGLKMSPDDPRRDMVEQIVASTDRAANLTRSLLAFSRKQEMHPVPCSLNEIIQGVGKFLVRTIGEHIAFDTNLAPGHLVILADRGQIEQVIINLATNARDAMETGGTFAIATGQVTLDAEFVEAHGYGACGEYALICVSDDGAGMDAATRRKIFEPFFTTKEVGKGTGLGLSIVYGIVQQHRGYIEVSSEPGRGTTFRIYLPLCREKAEQAGERSLVSLQRGEETILVVEDEAPVRELVQSVLEEFGYRSITAVDGDDALEKYRLHRDSVKLVFTDLILPKKSGREVYDGVKAIDPDAKVLFTSGYTADVLQREGEGDRQYDILMKPIDPLELARKVRALLDA